MRDAFPHIWMQAVGTRKKMLKCSRTAVSVNYEIRTSFSYFFNDDRVDASQEAHLANAAN